MSQPEIRRVSGASGCRIATYAEAEGPGAVAVIGHGAGSSARFVRDAFGPPLRAAGYRLVTYDLRGHGRSDPVRDVAGHSTEAHVADLAAVCDAHAASVVGGVSLAAHAAAWFAAGRTGITGLVACLPAWAGDMPDGSPHAVVAAEIRDDGLESVLARLRADPGVPHWLAELLRRDWRTHDRLSLEAALVALEDSPAPDASILRRVPCPAAVVAWAGDPGHPLEVARTWVRCLADARLETVAMDDVGSDVTTLGRAAVRGLRARGV